MLLACIIISLRAKTKYVQPSSFLRARIELDQPKQFKNCGMFSDTVSMRESRSIGVTVR
jgi:hypothetical protein